MQQRCTLQCISADHDEDHDRWRGYHLTIIGRPQLQARACDCSLLLQQSEAGGSNTMTMTMNASEE